MHITACSLVPCIMNMSPPPQGLGKRPVERGRNQHLSENHTSWELPTSPLASTYTSDYLYGRQKTRATGIGVTAPSLAVKQDSSLLRKFHVYSKHSFHHFPHTHKTSASLPPQPSLSRMAEWFHHTHKTGGTTAPTPLVVLAESQKPFLPHNPWTYSYQM